MFMSASETHNRKNVNRSIAESLAGLEVVLARARAEGLRCEGVISTVVRVPVRGSRAARARAGDRGAPARRGRAGDRVRRHDRDGEPAPGGGAVRAVARGAARGRADRALSQHARAGPRERAGGAARPGSTASSRASASSAAARCRRGRRGTSPARTSSRCCRRWGSRRASTWMRWLRARARRRRCLGRPLGSHTLVAGPVEWG